MQWLKSLVIGMGILILLGLALLTYGFIKKTGDPSWRLFSSPSAPQDGSPKAFGELNLPLPEGCVIDRVVPGGERAYVHLRPRVGPCNRVIVIDAARGRVLGTIQPAP